MFCIMILSGLLSTMNVYVDKIDDIRWSLNDIYMTLLMTGWMITFMSIYYKDMGPWKLYCYFVILCNKNSTIYFTRTIYTWYGSTSFYGNFYEQTIVVC